LGGALPYFGKGGFVMQTWIILFLASGLMITLPFFINAFAYAKKNEWLQQKLSRVNVILFVVGAVLWVVGSVFWNQVHL